MRGFWLGYLSLEASWAWLEVPPRAHRRDICSIWHGTPPAETGRHDQGAHYCSPGAGRSSNHQQDSAVVFLRHNIHSALTLYPLLLWLCHSLSNPKHSDGVVNLRNLPAGVLQTKQSRSRGIPLLQRIPAVDWVDAGAKGDLAGVLPHDSLKLAISCPANLFVQCVLSLYV